MKFDNFKFFYWLKNQDNYELLNNLKKDYLIRKNFYPNIEIDYGNLSISYLNEMKRLLKHSNFNSVEEFFKSEEYIIEKIVWKNVNAEKDKLKKFCFEKIDYLINFFPDYFENLDFENEKEKDIYYLLRDAEFFILTDYLYDFHNEFKEFCAYKLKEEWRKYETR